MSVFKDQLDDGKSNLNVKIREVKNPHEILTNTMHLKTLLISANNQYYIDMSQNLLKGKYGTTISSDFTLLFTTGSVFSWV